MVEAWLWTQLADKQFKWKAQSKDIKELWLLVTAVLDVLLTVPPTPFAPKPTFWPN